MGGVGRVRHEVGVGAPLPIPTFKRSQLGSQRSYEGLAEHGKSSIPKLTGVKVPDAFRRLSKKGCFAEPEGCFPEPEGCFAEPDGCFPEPEGCLKHLPSMF